MAERPILFSAPMVRALLAGTKTQTRRLVKPQPCDEWSPVVELYNPTVIIRGEEMPGAEVFGASDDREGRVCPYGRPGDRLWVRETFVQGWPHNDNGVPDQFDVEGNERPQTTWYRASSPQVEWCTDGERTEKTPWRPSIHMPRAASRITLEITEVRVERLGDISAADARAEGIEGQTESGPWRNYLRDGYWFPEGKGTAPQLSFASLWHSINGADSWQANPFVWAVSFRLLATNT